MCGIAGCLEFDACRTANDLNALARAMATPLTHRGPDASGSWCDEAQGIALGFRRLSIIDLSPNGDQPMISHCGRYVMVFNGEIYNFRYLRDELKSHGETFVGSSDSEVALAGIVHWGVRSLLERSNGMFAMAVWDRLERVLWLARDRLGEKPLYYGWADQKTLVFGSELSSIRAHPRFHAEIDRDALSLYFRHGCIPAPYSIYRNIRKLEPGSWVALSRNTGRTTFGRYWSFDSVVEQGLTNPLLIPPEEIRERLEELIAESVRLRMVADVPLGAFLSGGIDSATVVALMQAHGTASARTFSIGFEDAQFDEAPFAKAVARHLQTDHTEFYVSEKDALAVVPELPIIYDEPFADSSQIPTYLVSRLARQEVTVALTGDGGDELFGGYPRYAFYEGLARTQRIPRRMRALVALSLHALVSSNNRRSRSILDHFGARLSAQGPRVERASDILRFGTKLALYRSLMSHWDEPTDLVLDGREPTTMFDSNLTAPLQNSRLEAMALDTVTYLPDDILTKVDRAAMANGLETRIPLLDHRIVEFSWRIPNNMKFKSDDTKRILRSILGRHVPATLTERSKMGFGVPLGSWLRGPLQEWGNALVCPSRVNDEGYLNPSLVSHAWNSHLEGKQGWHYRLWDILVFQAWLEKYHR
jgi:asparagine synthase (glutamine-hydrolysing)